MKRMFSLFVIVISFAASAQPSASPSIQHLRMAGPRGETAQKPRPAFEKGFLAMAGMDVRSERNEMQDVQNVMMPNLALGYIWSNWIGNFEYGHRDSSTGNATLAVDRRTEQMMLWGYWQATDHRYVTPYLGIGLGTQRVTVKTNLMGSEDTDTSGAYWTTGAGAGVRFLPKTRLWLSAEGRLYKNSHQDPDPQLGLMLRIGFRL